MTKKDREYTAESIQIFEGVKAVQKRPGMYLGSTDQDGFHHLIWEIIDNSLDEYLAGFCDTIKITIKKDNVISIEDNGRGIPPETHSKTGVSTIETVFTSLHAGGKFDSQTYQVSGGLHGVGSTVVNAMSDYLKVDVFRGGKTYNLEFIGGIATDKGLVVSENQEAKKNGTTVEFKPNLKLFDDSYSFNEERIIKRLQETAFINDGVRIVFSDKRDGTEKSFYHKNGIRDFLDFLTGEEMIRDQHESPVFGKKKVLEITCRFIFRYTTSNSSNIYSFCNNIKTHEGGAHERGFKKAIT
nr:DNA gyrase subunit B-like [Lytechinus pictus]